MGKAALIVRAEQVEALRAVYFEELEETLERIFARRFPAACERMGEGGVRGFIRESARRAEALGATTERDMGKYITMELALGAPAMEDLVAAQRERLKAWPEGRRASVLIGAVCKAGLRKLAGTTDAPLVDAVDEGEA